MPRQIIDTELSRPAYERRRLRRLLAMILLLVVVAAACWWFLAHRPRGQETGAAGGSAPTAELVFGEKGVRSVMTLGEMNAA
jgi:ribose/xylose/arabinose/galactoside ABC-type transport system permease subunit